MGSAPRVDFTPHIDTSNILSTVTSAAVATAGSVLTTGYNSLADTYNSVRTYTQQSTGNETDAEKKARETQDAVNAEQNARSTAYNDALNDNTLDQASRQELVQLYQSGASSTQIAAQLNAAREGKGIYGVRRINANQQALQLAMPGRKQTLSLGKKSILGV
jgi:deoxycytidylate deaminase